MKLQLSFGFLCMLSCSVVRKRNVTDDIVCLLEHSVALSGDFRGKYE